jgi:hypothetical protein
MLKANGDSIVKYDPREQSLDHKRGGNSNWVKQYDMWFDEYAD